MPSPRRYELNSGIGGATVTTTAKTVVSVIATTAIRPSVYDWTFGTTGTPADNVLTVSLKRETVMTAGTNCTTVTPNPLDSGDPAATATSGGAFTSEPTIGVVLFSVGVNQRATYRWVAAPGSELVAAAAAAGGIGLLALSPAYANDVQATVYYSE